MVNKRVGFVLMLVGVFFLVRYLSKNGMLKGRNGNGNSETE